MKKFFIIFLLLLSCTNPEIGKNKFNYYLKDANSYFENGNYFESLKYYKICLKYHKPKDGNFYYKLAFSYDKGEKNYKKAKKYYLKALKYLNTQRDLKKIAACYFNLGVIALKESKIDEKENYFASAYSLLKKIEEMDKADGLDYFRLGYYFLDKKEFDTAIYYFEKSIEKLEKESPKHFYHSGAYFNIGKIYWDNQNYKDASIYWKKALELEPTNSYFREWYENSLKYLEHKSF